MAHPITIVTLQTKRAWRTCLFATAVFSHVSLLEYFCSYVQDHHPKGAQTTWSVVLVIQTRYFLLFDNRRAVYKRSTKCCGDKSITSFTDSLNFIQLLRVVITPSSDNVWIRPAVNAVQWRHYSFVLIHVKSLTRFSSGKPRNIVWKCLHDTEWLYFFSIVIHV